MLPPAEDYRVVTPYLYSSALTEREGLDAACGSPVGGLQEFGIFAPIRLHLYERFKEYFFPRHSFNLQACRGPDAFQHGPAGSDDDDFLSRPLDVDRGVHVEQLAALAAAHSQIDSAVLEETAKLHAGDDENLRLWHEFLPHCRDENTRVYRRLNVAFDHEHGESFYHQQEGALFALAMLLRSFSKRHVFLSGNDVEGAVNKEASGGAVEEARFSSLDA